VEHPRLDLYSTPLNDPPNLTPEERIKESATFEILVCLMERAFLMYRGQSSRLRKARMGRMEGVPRRMEPTGKLPPVVERGRESVRRVLREIRERLDRDTNLKGCCSLRPV
jgi:hypothetical protein